MKEFLFEEGKNDFDKIFLRRTQVPGGAGVTYGEMYDAAAADNELEPGEDIFGFAERIKKAQEGDDDSNNPGGSWRKAA